MLTLVKINETKQQVFLSVYQTNNSLPIIQKTGTEVDAAVCQWFEFDPGHICINQQNYLERRVGRGGKEKSGKLKARPI